LALFEPSALFVHPSVSALSRIATKWSYQTLLPTIWEGEKLVNGTNAERDSNLRLTKCTILFAHSKWCPWRVQGTVASG
jgi:hypothetical protein